MEKRCKRCGEVKILTEFHKEKLNNDGHCGSCKSCRRTYDRLRGNRLSLEDVRRYRRDNPTKYKAHTILNNALRDGKLTRLPCEVCGAVKTVAHHDDYTKPLAVRWLCQVHHVQWHSQHKWRTPWKLKL